MNGNLCYVCGIERCVLCESDDVCSECESGYALNGDNGCVLCLIDNCTECIK